MPRRLGVTDAVKISRLDDVGFCCPSVGNGASSRGGVAGSGEMRIVMACQDGGKSDRG